VVMVPGRIPGHMGDSVIPHGETIRERESARVRECALKANHQCLPTDGLSLQNERCLAVARRRVLAMGIGLAVRPTTFILVPAGVVLLVIGAVKFFRSSTSCPPHQSG
jgi:hypothetical protein